MQLEKNIPSVSGSQIAEMLIVALRANSVPPAAKHIAAPGEEWGAVCAYAIGDEGNFAIADGNNASTRYALTDDIEDLPAWLVDEEMEDDAAALANARNQEPTEVAGESVGAVKVITAQDYHGATRLYDWMRVEGTGEVEEFGSVAHARAMIDAIKAESYRTHSNEVGAPVYYIVAS